MEAGKSRSLTREVLMQMALRISIVVIIISGLSYQHILSTLYTQEFDSLDKYIVERGQKESAIFQLAEDNHQVFKTHFINAYRQKQAVSNEQFWSIFEPWEDGTTHLKKKAFSGYYRSEGLLSQGTTAYIGPQAPIEEQEFRNRLFLAYQLVDRYSDAWTNRFANVYISMLENVNIVHWPNLPWADNAQATLDVTTEEWVYITTQENNPTRKSVWTGLYFDPTADEWMVSCETPVDIDGKHLLNVGHDILLNKLFDRVFNDHLTGAYNFIVRKDGRLIAHPDKEEELRNNLGMLDIKEHNDVVLLNMYQQIKSEVIDEKLQSKVLDNSQGNAFLAVSRIAGPDWFFVTVYPKELLTSAAKEVAKFIFILGVVSLVVELFVLYLLIHKKIISPLDLFRVAISRIDMREYSSVAQGNTPLPENHDNEIGKLARTLRHMAQSIEQYSLEMRLQNENLEAEVQSRTQELEQAKSMAENQARVDELTQIPNRRYFNEIAEIHLYDAERNQTPICWCIIDIDFFKQVNDRYGHASGDIALKAVAKLLNDSLRKSDLLARIGGEEFVISFPNTTIEECWVLVERIRQEISEIVIESEGIEFSLTISAGVSGGIVGHYDYNKLYAAADKALYKSKNGGRNRVSAERKLKSSPI
ncbi:MAG: diguanylate cyclase [Paraglaciecola sp.]|nr:diguanylate cyclase [Paraglaciecola sp.]